MRYGLRLLFAIVALSFVAALSYCEETTSKTELDLGTLAYRQGKYEEAIAYFERSVSLDPTLIGARLYLATAYSQQFIPGAQTPDNEQIGRKAIEEYMKVLVLDPKNSNAMKGTAKLYLEMEQFDSAKGYYRKAIDIEPEDAEPHFAIGVIDWSQAYQARMAERTKLRLPPDRPLIDKEDCWKVRSANEDNIKDGIEMLTKAISLRSDYDDAMAYMNLMYRELADIQCGNRQAHESDLKLADRWVDATMTSKKAKAIRGKNELVKP